MKFALTDISRNKGMSVAAIFVLVITILLVTGLFFLRGVNSYLISEIQSKIDVTAYFRADTQEQEILNVKNELLQQSPDIKNIEYVSKEAALAEFREKHKDSEVLTTALTEVGENPFLPSLNITTSGETAEYAKISETLQQEKFSALIEKVDFSQKKDTIEKIFSLTSNVNKFGIGLGILLMLVVVLVVFNTIKLIIDASRDEIATMRIVGASAWFVRTPFIIEGALFGFISFLICFVITMAAAYFLTGIMLVIMPGFNVFKFFGSNLLWILLIQIGTGVGLGVISSYIVVRRYLKV